MPKGSPEPNANNIPVRIINTNGNVLAETSLGFLIDASKVGSFPVTMFLEKGYVKDKSISIFKLKQKAVILRLSYDGKEVKAVIWEETVYYNGHYVSPQFKSKCEYFERLEENLKENRLYQKNYGKK